ncbi:DUF4333 domain-containing protein [Mycobacterium sp. AMU20-3851]|uniref:DUF4333 domain-containing protein n=1 Tax=Mycobacterium sp. AMU20-3851 TaxID=3122055 RepID=UPI0037549B53
MTRPPDPQQPWWARPGGAPPPGAGPQPGPPPRQPYPAAPQPHRAPHPGYPPPTQRPVPPPQPPLPPRPPQPQRPAPVIDPNRYQLPPGTPAPHRAPPKRTDGRRWLIGGAIAIAVIDAGIAVWQFAFRDSTVIRVEQAEEGVRQILSDPINGYGANSISALRCNGGKDPSAAKGDSFTCAVEIDGAIRQVYVEFQDDKGTFAVDGPR